jgi:hypothetical protein
VGEQLALVHNCKLNSATHSLTHSLTQHSYALLLTRALTHSLTHTHALTHLLTQLSSLTQFTCVLTHPLNSLTHLRTHALGAYQVEMGEGLDLVITIRVSAGVTPNDVHIVKQSVR